MPHKTHKPEGIVAKLRQVDVSVRQAGPVSEAVRSIRVLDKLILTAAAREDF